MGANLSDDEEEYEENSPLSFKDAIDHIEKLRTYSVHQNVSEDTFYELNSILIAIKNTQTQSARETTVKDIFNSASE